MKKNNFTILLVGGGLAGIIFGALFTASKAKASEPVVPTPSGIPAASVIYDEKWVATEVCYATASGYYKCDDPSVVANNNTMAGQLGYYDGVPYVVYHPKVKVSRWHVYGHMHFSR